jgi:hypothetical protein
MDGIQRIRKPAGKATQLTRQPIEVGNTRAEADRQREQDDHAEGFENPVETGGLWATSAEVISVI